MMRCLNKFAVPAGAHLGFGLYQASLRIERGLRYDCAERLGDEADLARCPFCPSKLRPPVSSTPTAPLGYFPCSKPLPYLSITVRSALPAASAIPPASIWGFPMTPWSSSPVRRSSPVRIALPCLRQLPAQAAANIEQSLSRFDPKWITSFTETSTNELTQGTAMSPTASRRRCQTSIMKAFSSGGIIEQHLRNRLPHASYAVPRYAPFPNPLYTTRLTFGYEQPLWRDFGTEINQLLNRVAPFYGTSFPLFAQTAFGNQLNVLNQGSSLAGGGTVFTEGILIARIRYDSQRADFERNVNNMVLQVEAAYWKLYQAYGNLYSYEELLRLVHKGWMVYEEPL